MQNNRAWRMVKDGAKAAYKYVPEGIRKYTNQQTLAFIAGLKTSGYFNGPPECLQILEIKTKNQYNLNEEALCKIFYHPDVVKNPVMIVSVAGPMRKGKSFLLSLLVNYFESGMNPNCFNSSRDIPKYFNWRSGSKRETVGIQMWSKPYLLKLNESRKIAVILMDTQGAFDRDGANVGSKVFSFGTLMSSVQIYNLKDNIDENDLQPLKLFVDYATKVSESLSSSEQPKPFQKLQFLVRDWPEASDYKMDEGQEYLDNELKVTEDDEPDIAAVRSSLKEAFSSLNCTLLPDPGNVIAGRKRKTIVTNEGKVIEVPKCFSDLEQNFKDCVIKFFDELFKPENRQPKVVNGTEVTGFSVMNFIYKYYELLESGKMENPMNVIEAVEVANTQTLSIQLLEDYHEEMDQILKAVEYMSENDLNNHHEKVKEKVIEKFKNKCRNLRDAKLRETYKKQLGNEIDEKFSIHKQNRKAKEENLKKVHRETVRKLFLECQKKMNKTSDPGEMEMMKTKALNEYRNTFDDDGLDIRGQFEKSLNDYLSDSIKARKRVVETEKNLEKNVRDCLDVYKRAMEKALGDSCVTEDELENLHEKTKKVIFDNLEKKVEYKTMGFDIDMLKGKVASAIDVEYQRICQRNTVMLEAEMGEFIKHLEKVKKMHLEFLHESTEGVYVKPATLRKVNDKFIEKVKKEQSRWKKDRLYEDLKKKEMQALEEQYQKFTIVMEERKGKFRESNIGVTLLAGALILVLAIPALALGIVVAIVAFPFILIEKAVSHFSGKN